MALTINQWLKGKVDYDVPDLSLLVILEDNGIADGALVSAISQKQKDLALADLYYWVASSSTSSSGEFESDGGWQHRAGVKNVSSRAYFRGLADALRAQWGVATPTIEKITMKDLY